MTETMVEIMMAEEMVVKLALMEALKTQFLDVVATNKTQA
jgi:hypothetical protein